GIPRTVESVATVLAVTKTGAAFVPVDPGYPAARAPRRCWLLPKRGHLWGPKPAAPQAPQKDSAQV
ncbi:hypothetical protein, partial [Nocardia carnea]|uniref:hypothetical protein n=1 Tax=Nocardia carnea TaxID=37328 RepID=UPI00245497E3